MNINEEYMLNVRKIKKCLKGKNNSEQQLQLIKKYRSDLMAEYAKKISHHCFHDLCIDDGYYKIKGKEIWVSDNESADFRVVTCEDCGTQIYLINDESVMWDFKIGDINLEIKSKQICKRM